MKIGILTQPLFFNYGGILQAYALQETLKRMGHEVILYSRESPSMSNRFPNTLKLNVKYLLRRYLGKSNLARNAYQNRLITKYTSQFIKKYIHTSPSLYNNSLLRHYYKRNPVDGFVVGSDQVWRPCNSPNIYNYFLDFCNNDEILRIAYAASFGVDKWEFDESETALCKKLIQKFNAVSVRESSGIGLCKTYLNVEAKQVLDPTMLLDITDYENLIREHTNIETNENDKKLFCYILDVDKEKSHVISLIEKNTGLNEFHCLPRYKDNPANIEKYGEECIYPPVEQWLASFSRAKMVVTDSFHGTVFSILFNKPFWVIGNKERGLSRFESLLKMFNLENRLLTTESFDKVDWTKDIEWSEVNDLMTSLRKISIEYLKENLK